MPFVRDLPRHSCATFAVRARPIAIRARLSPFVRDLPPFVRDFRHSCPTYRHSCATFHIPALLSPLLLYLLPLSATFFRPTLHPLVPPRTLAYRSSRSATRPRLLW